MKILDKKHTLDFTVPTEKAAIERKKKMFWLGYVDV